MTTKMPFGKHRGQYLDEIEATYLHWLLTLDNLGRGLRYAVEHELAERDRDDRWLRRQAEGTGGPGATVAPFTRSRTVEGGTDPVVADQERQAAEAAAQREAAGGDRDYALEIISRGAHVVFAACVGLPDELKKAKAAEEWLGTAVLRFVRDAEEAR